MVIARRPQPPGGKVPLVSVIMPVYNGGRHLPAAVESILGQTFADFELLVLDDGSTDRSLEVLRHYQEHDERIRLTARENRGQAASLNEMIDQARGAWIARMDDDDVALPRRLERQLEWLERTGADICGCWARSFGSADRRVERHPQSDEAIKMALLFGSPFVHPTVVMRSSVARELRYDEAWERTEDYDLWVRAARAGYRLANLPEVLLLYRRHPGQASFQQGSRQRMLTQKIQKGYWAFMFDRLGLDRGCIDEVLKIRALPSPEPDMERVDQAFAGLLGLTGGETRATVFDHVTKLYYRVAADCPDSLRRWGRLNEEYGTGRGWGVKLKLWLLRRFRLRADSGLFCRAKRIYFSLVR